MDELTFQRPDDLTDDEWTVLVEELEGFADTRRAQLVAARTYAPHLVAHTPVVEDDPDQDAVAAKDRRKTRRDTITECPDCTKGLTAKGDVLVCLDLARSGVSYSSLGGVDHDVIACGR